MFKWLGRSRNQSNTPPVPPQAMIERLEQRQLMDATAQANGIFLRFRTNEQGFHLNITDIKIPFDNNITLLDASKIRIRGYVHNPLSGKQKKIVINFSDVHVQSDGKTLALSTDRWLRKGARFYFDAGALADSSGDPVTPHIIRSPKGQTKDRFTMTSRAFRPFDFNKFLPAIFAASPTPSTANTVLDEATVEPALDAFLQKKVDAGLITAQKKQQAMDRFNDSTDRQRIPDHNLRAALLSLVGTFAESSIGVYLDGNNLSGKPYTVVAFADTSSGAVIADTQVLENGRLRTRVKPEFASEPFQALSAILAHEAVHQDVATSLQEELVANIFESAVWVNQLDVDDDPASSGSALVAEQNTELLAFLNSGRGSFPIVGTHTAPIKNNAQGVFFGAKSQSGGHYQSHDNYVRRQYLARGAQSGNTAGNPTLDTYLSAITGTGSAGQFSEELINRLDQRIGDAVDVKQAIRVAGVLRLTV